MAFKKRKFRRLNGGRRFSRRRFSRNPRLKRFVKGVVRRMSEIKYNTANNALNIDAGIPFIANIVPTFSQGPDKTQRIGNKIKYKFMQFRMTMASVGGAAPLLQLSVRVMIVQTRLPLTAPAPLLTDILDAVNITSSVRNTAARVILDRTFYLGVEGALNVQSQRPSSIFIKKKVRINNNVDFKSAAQTVPADPKDNYYLVIFTNQGAALNNTLATNWFNRISYIDL